MNSKNFFKEAKKVLVGGVNSPVRAMNPHPFFTEYGAGSKIYDIDGKEYLDYCLAYGPLILGHAHPLVLTNLKEGPSINDILFILGKKGSLMRLNNYINNNK